MRFQDWKNEKLQNDSMLRSLERAVMRDWDIGNLLVHVNVFVSEDYMKIGIGVSTWRPQAGGSTTLASGKKCEGGYFDYQQRAIDMLTAAQLRIVAGMRAVVEEWVAGARPELPVNTPYEAIKDEMLAEAKSAVTTTAG
jgi:hypothetical protein